MKAIERPWYPIIYVRGYAGNDAEIEDTVADPYMGFNLGSTKFRQLWDGTVRRHYFESPLLRLIKDYEYNDVYRGGQDMPLEYPVSARSIFIYRYYDDQFFDDLTGRAGDLNTVSGEGRKIEEFANGLGTLIERIRDRICLNDTAARNAFRVYLIAHSMGGLVCRCFLQNPAVSNDVTKALVDKVFTYATPHNGIDLRMIGNVPGFFTRNDADNFNRERMAGYLGLNDPTDVSDLNGQFDARRFFCLVGTNSQDYSVASGLSRRLAGPMSDGLVRIANATVTDQRGVDEATHSPRAFVHRSHSGQYGIVNSEEGYQNLVRFLFGDVRVDGVLEVDEITLPKEVQDAKDAGQTILASYHFEVVVRIRGHDWELHRRTVREESAIFRKFDDMFPKKEGVQPRHPHLFSTFLSARNKVVARRPSLGFAIELGVVVPEYTIDGLLWRKQHFGGSYLFREAITIEATPSTNEQGDVEFKVKYGLNSRTPNRATSMLDMIQTDAGFQFRIPIASGTRPGLKGTLVLTATEWN